MKKKLFVISGCSGVGKGTVLKKFMAKHNKDFMLSVSCTTRKPRIGEVDGVNYFFLTRDEFEKNIKQDLFLEYAQFADNFYGTKKDFVNEKLKNGFNVILEIETNGALQVKNKMPEAVLIFIAPPGEGTTELEKRLRGRNTENEEIIQKRLAVAKDELKIAKKYDYILVNDDLELAVEELERITSEETLNA